MKRHQLVLFILLVVAACSPFSAPATHPALSVRATVQDNPTEHNLQFKVESNLPLTSVVLLFGAEGGRAPINVPLTPGELPTVYQWLVATPNGLRLPRDVNELRYSWTVRSVYGETLTIAQSMTSTQLLPDDSPMALQWQAARQGNITLYYLPDTPAARDIERLKQIADESLSRAEMALDTTLKSQLSVYLLPRIFWQGGAAFGGKTVFISYADRPYTGVALGDYVAHEGAHALTQDWGNLGAAGGILAEGIAVFATGGHYQPDLLDESAAALLQSALFIAPPILRRDFSKQQHEIAYTESGSFVKFLIERYGLEKFRALMRRPNDWRAIYDKDFDALTQDWLAYLRGLTVEGGVQPRPQQAGQIQRWQLKVRYYDVLRQYEERLDPDARRLPSVPVEKWDAALRQAMRVPADQEDNRVLELMMLSAIDAIETTRSDEQLRLAEKYLDEVERKIKLPASADGALLREVRTIVQVAETQEMAFLNRDWNALRSTLDAASHPQFAAQFIDQARAQPAWLRFVLSPARLTWTADQAWLTVAQWAEPLERTQKDLQGRQDLTGQGQRWVLALRKLGNTWRVTGRWPDASTPPMAR